MIDGPIYLGRFRLTCKMIERPGILGAILPSKRWWFLHWQLVTESRVIWVPLGSGSFPWCMRKYRQLKDLSICNGY